MSKAVQSRLSVEEFEHLYLGKRAELWRGEVREYMPAGPKHGKIAAALTVRLGARLLNTREGVLFAAETGFVVPRGEEHDVLAPDVAFIRKERLPEGEFPPGFCRVVPDLVVEVVSPNDPYTELRQKVADWLAGGVQLVWVVDPERRVIEVWRAEGLVQTLREGDVLTGDPVLPGFQVKVSELFE
ncbi:MAG: Uma2 family endonuclease [Armatimonadota bacterium]